MTEINSIQAFKQASLEQNTKGGKEICKGFASVGSGIFDIAKGTYNNVVGGVNYVAGSAVDFGLAATGKGWLWGNDEKADNKEVAYPTSKDFVADWAKKQAKKSESECECKPIHEPTHDETFINDPASFQINEPTADDVFLADPSKFNIKD